MYGIEFQRNVSINIHKGFDLQRFSGLFFQLSGVPVCMRVHGGGCLRVYEGRPMTRLTSALGHCDGVPLRGCDGLAVWCVFLRLFGRYLFLFMKRFPYIFI